MNARPNRAWAYAIVKRWEGGDRAGLSHKNYETACAAIRADQNDAHKALIESGQIDMDTGEVLA